MPLVAVEHLMSGFVWVHEAGRHTQRVSTHEEVTRMLAATRKKALLLLTAAALALILVSTPLGVSSAFAEDCQNSTTAGC